jgi:hypothetical protein
MKKKQKINVLKYARAIDIASLTIAIIFMLAVTKTAAVAAGHVAGLEWGTIPLAYILILGLLLVFLNWYNAKAKFSILGVVSLAVLLTSAAIWLVGLHNAWPLSHNLVPM